MGLEVKYKIDLADNAIAEIFTKYGVVIPKDLVRFIKQANGATLSKTKFMLKVDEKVFGAVLSFNPNEDEGDSFDDAMTLDLGKTTIPFGVDPFGNYICYNSENGNVVFFDHEEDTLTVIAKSLQKFLDMLYE